MFYTQTSRICCWVGIYFVTELCLRGKRSVVLGSVCASRHAQRRNEEVKHLLSVDGVQRSFREQTGEGKKKNLNLSEILFWVYCMCCSWSSPGGGKKLFLWPTLLWSAWALSPFLIFSEVFLWNWIWKTRWLILFCEPWSWQYGVFMCAFSVPFENKVLSLYKQAISFGWSGFSMGCQVSFSLKWNSGLLKVLGPALLRKERKILKCGQKCCLLHRAH